MRSSSPLARKWMLSSAATVLAVALVAQSAGATAQKVKVGLILDVKVSTVLVNKSTLLAGQTKTLYAGDALRTSQSGVVEYTLHVGQATLTCRSFSVPTDTGWAKTLLKLSPQPTSPPTWKGGESSCSKNGKTHFDPTTSTARLQMTDPVFDIVVTGKKTVVKVTRGVVIVSARSASSKQAVVVGRNQRTTVTAGTPAQPTAIGTLTPQEKASQAFVSANLPPLTDTTGPTLTLDGPTGLSSLRSADFSFSSQETTVTYSCGIDGSTLHLCTSPQHFEVLATGPHTFTVEALDANGNRTTKTAQWTIDTSRIAYASDASGTFDIYSMNPDGSNQQQLTADKTADDEDPAWSPDRKQIAFHSNRDGLYEIYIMNADGSGQTELTHNKLQDRNPAWSPDGKQIVFEQGTSGTRQLFVMNADGSNIRQFTNTKGENFDPAWSPDGTKIAFASSRDGNDEIYVMNSDGTGQTNLTNNPATEFNPAWSPNGKQIAFHSSRDGSTQQIYTMNPDGSNVTRVSKTSFDDYNPTWAPDNSALAFQSNLDSSPRMAIWLMNVDGSHRIRLTPTTSNALEPDWGPAPSA